MKYMGSKNRIAKHILPIMLAERKPNQWWVEPFVGGANMIDKVDGRRIGNDIHEFLIALLVALRDGYIPPTDISKELYYAVKSKPQEYPKELVGFVGFLCSYGGKWWGGFAGKTKTKTGTIRDYQAEAINNVVKQAENLKGVIFQNKPYYELELPPNSMIYCDPPYEGTTKYANDFDHNLFWNWVRDITKQGHTVFISEYNAPTDFECIWQKEAKSSLSANGKIGGNKVSVEKLFRYKHENL